jgi:DNA-binding beta-propeller fold protein YncE
MHFGRMHYFTLAVLLAGTLGTSTAQAGPLAVVANFQAGATTSDVTPGTVAIVDTATDQLVGSPLPVGVNPAGVVITPDGTTAIVACAYSADLWFIDLTASPPKLTGTVAVGSGAGNTFFPVGLAVSADGQYVAVTSLGANVIDPVTGLPVTPQNNLVKVVSVKNRSVEQELDVSTLPDPGAGTLSAEAVAFSPKGAIVLASSEPAPALFALSFADGLIDLPDAASNNGQLNAFGGTGYAQPTNVAISPDGSIAIVPAGRQFIHTYSIDSNVIMKETSPGGTGISSGGDGAQSVAITADGKLAYVLNLLPPGNISQFQIQPGSTVKSTGFKFTSSSIPQEIVQLVLGGLPVGNQMLAVTPDGSKIYTVNPYAPGLTGELEVFQTGKADAVKHLNVGVNPYAIAIQPQ